MKTIKALQTLSGFFFLALAVCHTGMADHWTSRIAVENSAKELQQQVGSAASAASKPAFLAAFHRDLLPTMKKVKELQSEASYQTYERVLANFKVIDEEMNKLERDYRRIEEINRMPLALRDAWISASIAHQQLWYAVTSGLPYEQLKKK